MSPPSTKPLRVAVKHTAIKKAATKATTKATTKAMTKATTKEGAPTYKLSWTAGMRLDQEEHAEEDAEWRRYLAKESSDHMLKQAELKVEKAKLRLADAELKLADAKL
jgi:hypothetical protein